MFFIIRNWFNLMAIITSLSFFSFIGWSSFSERGRVFSTKRFGVFFTILAVLGFFWVVSVGGFLELHLSECFYV